MNAKDELLTITRAGDWAMQYASVVVSALERVQARIADLNRKVEDGHWTGESGEQAAIAFNLVEKEYAVVERAVREIVKVLGDPFVGGSANYALRQARYAAGNLPSPFVPKEIRDQVAAAKAQSQETVIIGDVTQAVDGALSFFESLAGDREERAAQAALDELQERLFPLSSKLRQISLNVTGSGVIEVDPDDIDSFFDEVFESPAVAGDAYGGMGGPPHSGPNISGTGPNPPSYGDPIPPGGGGPKPPGTGGPDPAGPYPPYVPGGRDDYISVDDGSTGWHSRGLGAGAMGVAGLGGALAARSSLANSGPAAGSATSGQGGLLGTGAGGAGVGGTGAGGAGAGGLGAGGRSGGPAGMMGGQGGKGGSEKDKKPSLNGYMAPKLEDDDAEFTPLPDSARAGGRDADAGRQP